MMQKRSPPYQQTAGGSALDGSHGSHATTKGDEFREREASSTYAGRRMEPGAQRGTGPHTVASTGAEKAFDSMRHPS